MNPEEALEIAEESYQQKLVTFVDILGFRSKVQDTSNKPWQIGNLVHLFKEVAGKPRVGRCAPMDCICFSDCIVRVTKISNPIDECDLTKAFFREVEDLAQAQLAAIGLGFFIRGGLSIGDIYISGNTVFGPALIEAYEIESKLAEVPRIMIADGLIAKLADGWKEHDAVREDVDGKYFVDYLTFPISYADDNGWSGELDKHKWKSESAVKEWTGPPAKKDEFIRWLAGYQQRVLEQYLPGRHDLKICTS